MDITEALRSIIWGVMSMLLHVIDVLWSAAKLICGLDFNNSGFKFISVCRNSDIFCHVLNI